MKILLSIITVCFVAHTYVSVADYISYAAPAPVQSHVTSFNLPEWQVKADNIVRKALMADLMDASADASDECTFTVNGAPVAVWMNGTLTLLP